MQTVEIRCPEDPRRLLSKLLLAGEKPTVVEGNLIEIACMACKHDLRREDPSVVRVLHRYNLIGELVETVVV